MQYLIVCNNKHGVNVSVDRPGISKYVSRLRNALSAKA